MHRMSDPDRPKPETPMIRQYLSIKAEHPDAILFYRMGDFYEMFFDDARVASRILNIALTTRDKGKVDPVPMCGVPFHSAENYIHRLVREGHSVAVCEQVEAPGSQSKLVRREVVRTVTPGTILTDGFVPDDRNNYVVAVCRKPAGTGLAFLDLSTGDFKALALDPDASPDEIVSRLAEYHPSEALFDPPDQAAIVDRLEKMTGRAPALPRSDRGMFDADRASSFLLGHFGIASLDAFGIPSSAGHLIGAAGAVLAYATATQQRNLAHVRALSLLGGGCLLMDAATQRNLELVWSPATGGRTGTLLSILDATRTPMGARLLRQWISRPLGEVEPIRRRHDAVGALAEDADLLGSLRSDLSRVLDIERLASRITLGQAGPRDLVALAASLAPVSSVKSSLRPAAAPLLSDLATGLETFDDLISLLTRAIREDAPVSVREGGFILPGFDAELDDHLSLMRESRRIMADLEAGERARTGIPALKIKYNRVFGYFVEISKSNQSALPADYVRKQTLVGAERYTFPALAELEVRILEAEERSRERELSLFQELCGAVVTRGEPIAATCRRIAELDVLHGFATVSVLRRYRRPVIDDGTLLEIHDGRHPVVEALNADEPFIPNDCRVDTSGDQILIITGPNMAGKSTYLRQVALSVVMAQAGCFVPCEAARIGVVDRLFTRIGATDYLVRGQSTFMVEMTETAAILNNATPRSLLILDEVGRGTSTFDGLSLAWAVVEYLHDSSRVKARTLFATHYHQLTELAIAFDGIRNLSTSVREWGDRIIFLRKIVDGGSDRSYGIHVARLAGLPARVIDRAKEIMANLEAGEFNARGLPRLADHASPEPSGKPDQMYLFGSAESDILGRLRSLDVNGITPLDALALLDELHRQARAALPT
jgi:DNA mismatch repair protein MutS